MKTQEMKRNKKTKKTPAEPGDHAGFYFGESASWRHDVRNGRHSDTYHGPHTVRGGGANRVVVGVCCCIDSAVAAQTDRQTVTR